MDDYKVLFQSLSGENEGKHEKPQSGQQVSRLRFKPWPLPPQSRSAILWFDMKSCHKIFIK